MQKVLLTFELTVLVNCRSQSYCVHLDSVRIRRLLILSGITNSSKIRWRNIKGVLEIYEKLRTGDSPMVINEKSLFISRFFVPKRYYLAHVGRYKINKKLDIENRLFNQVQAEPIDDQETGEVLAQKGDKL